MNKDILEYNICLISEQLTLDQLIFARRNRDWNKFDKMNEIGKLITRFEELRYFEDDINSQLKPKGYFR